MRETITDFAVAAYTVLLPLAWIALAIAVLVLLPMAAFPRTRAAAGNGLALMSLVFGATTWLLGAAVTFASFGWIGLIVGLVIFGIGVVPLAILAAFFKLKLTSLGISLIIMSVITFAARAGGIYLAKKRAAVR